MNFSLLLGCLSTEAQTNPVKQLPPPGISIPQRARLDLEKGAKALRDRIHHFQNGSETNREVNGLMPDVEIYHKAVDWALRYNEFFRSNEVSIAQDLLRQGNERLSQLERGKPDWTQRTGLVIRAYRSRIDQSIQPYGLVIPASFATNQTRARRLDLWFHGRDDKLTELKFIDERQKKAGEFAPDDTLVLHLYGRYMNAFKFAGETDVFEALEDVRHRYPIDPLRITVRGFSMGGAATWHLAAHHPGRWAAAAPGAGFAETARYLKVNREATPWYEQKLWHLYDATDYAGNFFNLPVVAYSGELDKQKQAADVMSEAMKLEGLELDHLIGPKTEHKYEPATKNILADKVDQLARKGRPGMYPEIHFTTWTLRYSGMEWVEVEGLERHWERARVSARLSPGKIEATTTNVTRIRFRLTPDRSVAQGKFVVKLDGTSLTSSDDRDPLVFSKKDGRWRKAGREDISLAKRPGLQGPIDDAFMDSFLFVRPTGEPLNGRTQHWVREEYDRAVEQWRAQFRGDAQVKDDRDVTQADMKTNHLILWGDPKSNQLLEKLGREKNWPLRWTADEVSLGSERFSAAEHLPILIHPNPLSPKRYVVVNSGFTFRGLGSNADQTPKLPDYAVINLGTPPSEKAPGKIVAAGFFDEEWRVR